MGIQFSKILSKMATESSKTQNDLNYEYFNMKMMHNTKNGWKMPKTIEENLLGWNPYLVSLCSVFH